MTPREKAIEAAARAIYDEQWPPLMGPKPTWEELSETNKTRCRAYAKAAIAAFEAAMKGSAGG